MMNSRERYEAAMKIEEPDRIPILNLGAWTANLIDVKIPEIVSKGEVWARAQMASLEKFGYDCVLGESDSALETQAVGAKAKIPDWHIPSSEPLVRSYEDLEKLEVPDPKKKR